MSGKSDAETHEREPMPRVLEALPPATRKGRPPKYDYKLLFDGNPHLMVRGEDYDCADQSVRNALINQGKRIGLRIATRGVEEGVAVQAFAPSEAEVPALR